MSEEATFTLSPKQAGWILGLVRSRTRKQQRRLVNVEEAEGESWHYRQLAMNLVWMEDTLELLEAVAEDIEELSSDPTTAQGDAVTRRASLQGAPMTVPTDGSQ